MKTCEICGKNRATQQDVKKVTDKSEIREICTSCRVEIELKYLLQGRDEEWNQTNN